MEVEIQGEVYENQGEQEVGKNNFKICKVIIKTKGKYPQYIPVDFTGDGINDAKNLSVGKELIIKGYVNGRMWDGGEKGVMYFLSVKGAEISYPADTSTSNGGDDPF